MRDNTQAHITQHLKTLAANAGFSYCGIAQAQQLDEEARRLENWLRQGKHGNSNPCNRSAAMLFTCYM